LIKILLLGIGQQYNNMGLWRSSGEERPKRPSSSGDVFANLFKTSGNGDEQSEHPRWYEKAGLPNGMRYAPNGIRTRGAKGRPAMKKHNSNKQITTKGDQKETFAFYIGNDLGDKMSDV
jgi:hypothetical protein